MVKNIKIFDTTLRDGEQSPGCSMHLNEKLEIALQLQRLRVDVIEAGFAVSSPGDFNSVKAVAGIIKDCGVASLCRANKGDIDAAYDALRGAAAPRIHIFIATSPLHMEQKLKMPPEKVLEKIAESIKYARGLVSDIEFSAEDASRSDREFLARACETAIENGATVLNIPDTVGYRTPQEMGALITYLLNNVKGIEKAALSAHNHNDLGLASANSLAMVLAGATQVECTINGIGERAGNASLEEIIMGLRTRPHFYQAQTRIKTEELYRACRLVSSITGVPLPPTQPVVGANAFAHESGIHQHGVLACPETYEIMRPADVGRVENKIVLGKHSGKHAFSAHIKELGYNLSEEEINSVFAEFKILADRKKTVSDRDIEVLLSHGNKTDTAGKYSLENFEITCKKNFANATVSLRSGNDVITRSANGDGPIDAAFNAVNEICGRLFELAGYSVSSVTEGNDAQGETVVKLKEISSHLSISNPVSDGEVNGRGVSTDIIESGLIAYIDAVNKLI